MVAEFLFRDGDPMTRDAGTRQMAQIRRFSVFGLAALLSIFSSLTASAQSGDPAAIQQKLDAQFKLTRTTSDLSDIVTAGDVVTIHKPLVMFATSMQVAATNNYKGGIARTGGMTTMIIMNPNTVQRNFVAEEKCWVTRIQVQKDGVLFQLYSDPYNDRRYFGNLKVLFPNKKEVPPVDVALALIAEVLTLVPSDDQGELVQPAPAPARGDEPIARGRSSPRRPAAVLEEAPAPEAALPAIAPPPPPSDAPPPTIELGQTRDQVTTALGQPVKIVKLGAKEIFYYKDLKVTFTTGKISNVE
jgi:hypothetical protein